MEFYLASKDAIANARKAFDAGTLQIQIDPQDAYNGCRYQGPCAIGVSLPKELQTKFDNYVADDDPYPRSAGIGELLDEGFIKTDNPDILRRLQHAHDEMDPRYFEARLKELEARVL